MLRRAAAAVAPAGALLIVDHAAAPPWASKLHTTSSRCRGGARRARTGRRRVGAGPGRARRAAARGPDGERGHPGRQRDRGCERAWEPCTSCRRGTRRGHPLDRPPLRQAMTRRLLRRAIGPRRDHPAGGTGHARRVRADLRRAVHFAGSAVHRRGVGAPARGARRPAGRGLRGIAAVGHRHHLRLAGGTGGELSRQGASGSPSKAPTTTGWPPASRRCSAPNRTPGCGTWPARPASRRHSRYSTSAPEPDATAWRWPAAATRSTRWR